MISRIAEKTLVDIARAYPIVAITGPRQSGKTTLSRKVFAKKPYVNLEDLEQQEFALQDPKGFLKQFPEGAIIDEAQRVPGLFSYLQVIVDDANIMGHFVVTGSQQFGLFSGITQSLAGRVGLLQLLPFSLEELQPSGKIPDSLEKMIFEGFYPPIYDRNVKPTSWYGNYVRTYIERDVRNLVQVRDLALFQTFVRMCAGRTGQLLNLSSLGADCGISHNTARQWLSILETSYIVFLLRPHHANFNKRLVKSPKLYFYDTGLAAWLLGIQDSNQLVMHPLKGELFETLVISEFFKYYLNHEFEPRLYFWRDHSGHEVDVIVDIMSHLKPIEIKSGQTINANFFDALKTWRNIAGGVAQDGYLIYGGDATQKRTDISVFSWRDLAFSKNLQLMLL